MRMSIVNCQKMQQKKQEIFSCFYLLSLKSFPVKRTQIDVVLSIILLAIRSSYWSRISCKSRFVVMIVERPRILRSFKTKYSILIVNELTTSVPRSSINIYSKSRYFCKACYFLKLSKEENAEVNS